MKLRRQNEEKLPLNYPDWELLQGKRNGFQEVWYLKMNDPMARKALWLRFTILSSLNGFRRVAEVWGTFFERKETGDISKVAVKETFDVGQFSSLSDNGFSGIQINGSKFTENRTSGSIRSKGQKITWDFEILKASTESLNFVPSVLSKSRIVQNKALTVSEDLRFNGYVEINGQKHHWIAAPGMQGHLSGSKNGHSWVWGHCNTFVNENGNPVPFIFEGITAKARLAGTQIPLPKMSAFLFHYNGTSYRFNSLRDSIHCRSEHSLTEWRFTAEKGDISFRGHARAEHRDFAGITYEDTDGSFLYCANSKLSDLTMLVYRKGKLESVLEANGTAAFEVVTRTKNPYVPLLI